jgi:dUTP pyrophosphatase
MRGSNTSLNNANNTNNTTNYNMNNLTNTSLDVSENSVLSMTQLNNHRSENMENVASSSLTRPYYTLYVYLETDDADLINKYKELFGKVQDKTRLYKNGANICIDAGIDVFTPFDYSVNGLSNKVKTSMKCGMYFNDGQSSLQMPSGFHVYPRSSTGASTPLRLANSVGIIDSGYRGELMGIFDNHSSSEYNIARFQRVLQICAPNLTYPIFPILVDNLTALDAHVDNNERGAGGLGSTGV